MKPQRNVRTTLAAALVASLLAVGAASAQSYSYFYGSGNYNPTVGGPAIPTLSGSGSSAVVGGGTYTDIATSLPSGFNGGTVREYDNVTTANGAANDGLLAAVSGNGSSGAGNPNNPGFSQTWTLGSGWGQSHADAANKEVIDSVTLYLFVNIISPNASTNPFTIFSGLLGNEGTPAGNFSISEATDEGAFYGITIPVALAQAGFSIGVNGTAFPTHSFSTYDESYADGTKIPGLAVSTHLEPIIVPEPSAALLGSLGSLLLFRRRRA